MTIKQMAWRKRLIELNPECSHQLWTDEHQIATLGLNLRALQKDYLGDAGASAVIRLKAILDHGGLFVDLQIEPLESFDALMGYSAAAGLQDGTRLCNAVFGAEKGHPWVAWQFERYHYNIGIPAYWGVELMSTAPRAGVLILPTEVLYPYLWDAPPDKRVVREGSLCVNHWNEK